jgi:hypothetical protein
MYINVRTLSSLMVTEFQTISAFKLLKGRNNRMDLTSL